MADAHHWWLICIARLLSLSLSCCFCLPPEGRRSLSSEHTSCLDQKARLACCRQRSPGPTQPSRALLVVWATLSQDWNMSRTKLVVLLGQLELATLAAVTAQGSQPQAPPQTPTRDTERLQLKSRCVAEIGRRVNASHLLRLVFLRSQWCV